MAAPVSDSLLELLARLRARLYDIPDRGPPSDPTLTHAWEADDALCLWKNAELVLFLQEAAREISRRVPATLWEWSINLRLDRVFITLPAPYLAMRSVALVEPDGSQRPFPRTVDPNASDYGPLDAYELRRVDQTERLILRGPPDREGYKVVCRFKGEPASYPTWEQRQTVSFPYAAALGEALVVYAEFLAYRKRDTDTEDRKRSDESLARFATLVGRQRDAEELLFDAQIAARGWVSTPHFI